MKILFLLTELPYPPFNGVRIKVFNLIKGLSERGHRIHLMSFVNYHDDFNFSDISELKKYCASVRVFPVNNNQSWFIRRMLSSIYRKDVIAPRYISNDFSTALKKAVEKDEIDLVHFDLVSLTYYIKSISKLVPSVASINDSYSLWLKNKLLLLPDCSLKSLLEKAYYSATFPLATRYEKECYNNFEKVHVVSDVDRFYLKGLNSELDIEVIPNGVDTKYFRPLGLPVDNNSLVFMASMNRENVSNIIWFLKKVFPRVSEQLPGVKLYLIGKDPPPELLNIAQYTKGVIPTGYVNDVRPYIDKAALVIDPTMKTCGILNHVLESMAMGKAIVGTSSSFIGINGSISWKHMVIAKNETDFALSIVRLIENGSERRTIENNARRLVERNYQWSAMITRYEKLYATAIEKFGDRVDCG
jgi:polysaccharide biosynthesis protein PslH